MDIELVSNFYTIQDDNVNLFNCIEAFDSGYDILYVIDKISKFNGLIIEKDRFLNFWKDDSANLWITRISEQLCIVDPANDNELNAKVKHLFDSYTIKESPILINGKMIGVAGEKQKPYEKCDWNVIDFVEARKYFNKKEKIYISSLADANLKDLYYKYRNFINISVLNETNIEDFIAGNYDLFIYSAEIYKKKNSKKQLNCEELFKYLFGKSIEKIKEHISIAKDWASLYEEECSLVACIKCFDKGYKSICVVDHEENFLYLICEHNFCEDFPQKNIRKWSNLFIEEHQDVIHDYNELDRLQ